MLIGVVTFAGWLGCARCAAADQAGGKACAPSAACATPWPPTSGTQTRSKADITSSSNQKHVSGTPPCSQACQTQASWCSGAQASRHADCPARWQRPSGPPPSASRHGAAAVAAAAAASGCHHRRDTFPAGWNCGDRHAAAHNFLRRYGLRRRASQRAA